MQESEKRFEFCKIFAIKPGSRCGKESQEVERVEEDEKKVVQLMKE